MESPLTLFGFERITSNLPSVIVSLFGIFEEPIVQLVLFYEQFLSFLRRNSICSHCIIFSIYLIPKRIGNFIFIFQNYCFFLFDSTNSRWKISWSLIALNSFKRFLLSCLNSLCLISILSWWFRCSILFSITFEIILILLDIISDIIWSKYTNLLSA